MDSFFFSEIKPRYYDSIRQYREEMLKDNSEFDGCSSLDRYEDIEKWNLNCKLFESHSTVPPGYSIGYEYLYMCDDDVIGMLNMRPEALNHPFLKQYGGHIGYSVKPSCRKKGIGTMMLRDFLSTCIKKYKLDKVLITCFDDNIASKKVIINNGGEFENSIIYPPTDSILERYWIRL